MSTSIQADDNEGVREESLLLLGASSKKTEIREGSSWWASSFIIINAGLGAGLLNFADSYNDAGGIVIALTLQTIMLVFCVLALIVLAYCSDVACCSTYQEVVETMCGKRAWLTCSLLIAVYCFGCCITFLIIIADQIDNVMADNFGPDFCARWYLSRQCTLSVTSIVIILPLCFPKKIDFLKYVSAMGVFAVIYVTFLVVYRYYTGQYVPGPIKTEPNSWQDVFLVIPTICFSYQCHISVVPVYSCLRKRTLTEFSKSVCVAMVACVLCYTLTAVYGYLTFGGNVNADILLSYAPSDTAALIAMIAVAAKMYVTYPILCFCGRVAADNLYIDCKQLSPALADQGEKTRRILMTLVWFFASLLLAVFIPDIGSVIGVLGSFAAVFIFVYPGMCFMQGMLARDAAIEQRRSKVALICTIRQA
ncbi:PREDICTED: putative sodium-coupled neutral amino acid transporter 7 isoform X2 [Priapulus caudatus]|uniref:Sodium-coupled neutral amino acid transporter 7 isoform X2 n=1 Tax=Priapulus caudatus TaxID=37621 RepID=A0ABM1EGV6_PRICU|nr:PREDICTED: putative sodium-coupled neutral amino acid transporter 7 isoform X2 [Priapulus caudatus]